MSLGEATALALRQGGPEVLASPRRFLARVADAADPESDEMRVLVRLCAPELLAPFRGAVSAGGLEALRDAEDAACTYLKDECRVEPGTAAAVASGIAGGVALYQGFSPQGRPRLAAQPVAPRPSSNRTVGVTPESQREPRRTTDIASATMKPIAPMYYTGAPLRPTLVLTIGDAVLTLGRDYTLDYRGNVGSPDSEAVSTVTAVGVGAYSGSVSTTFRIIPQARLTPVRGQDIHIEVDVTKKEAREGALKYVEYDVPSTGQKAYCNVQVPAGSANWSFVSVPNMGDFGAGGGPRGNLLVLLHIVADERPEDAGAKGSSPIITRRAALAIAGGALVLGGIGALAVNLSRAARGDEDTPVSNEQQEVSPTPLVAVSAGGVHTVGLRSDGTAVATGSNRYGQCDVSDWSDLVAIDAGESHTVGLRSDGTAVATGDNWYGQCAVGGSDWADLVAVSAGTFHTVGLRSNGTVVAVGLDDGRCKVSDWHDIVAVSAGYWHTVGLRSDGTAVATGSEMNEGGECDVSSWTDLTAVSAGTSYTAGLHSDGTAVCAGDGSMSTLDITGWEDLVAVSAGDGCVFGLFSNGTANVLGVDTEEKFAIYGWREIVAISAGHHHTVGLRSDGRAVARGLNDDGQCDISGW